MRSVVLFALSLMAATGGGCVTVHNVRRPVSESDIRAINDATRESPPARVEYIQTAESGDAAPTPVIALEAVDKAEVKAIGIRAEHVTLEGGRVKSVRVVSHGWGTLQGLAVGGAIGSLFGLVIVAADDSHSNLLFSRNQQFIFGTVAFGALGGLVGALVGGGTGRQTVFVFDDAH